MHTHVHCESVEIPKSLAANFTFVRLCTRMGEVHMTLVRCFALELLAAWTPVLLYLYAHISTALAAAWVTPLKTVQDESDGVRGS